MLLAHKKGEILFPHRALGHWVLIAESPRLTTMDNNNILAVFAGYYTKIGEMILTGSKAQIKNKRKRFFSCAHI